MNAPAKAENKESIAKIFHPTIGEIYCLNESDARATLHEICDDRLYLQAGVSISAGDVVLDIGTNIGVFTLFAAKQGAQVYAYEPMPPTYAVLLHNVTAHGLDRVVRTQNIGLSDRAEEKTMFHYLKASVCDSWTAQDGLFDYLAENWQHALEMFATADPNEFAAISALGSRAEQQAAVRQRIKDVSASAVQIK
jgi:FkbM family methyltransferase